ncbi:hypothetical protein C0993_002539 [Termitomyces sp. T159_Od127]|nr:hypothetical protein C0993_002539 [Termitomyces sp. T159_Od127]
MSKLAQDAAAFKSVLKRQDYTSWHSQPPAPSETATPASLQTPAESSSPSTPKKKRPKTSAGVISRDLVQSRLKPFQGTQNPMRLQDIAIVTNTPLDTDSFLLEKFKAHDRILWDPKTDLYSYKARIHSPHEFNFRNKAALLTEIQRQTRKGGGIPVRALKESWKEAPAAIEELEKEGEVLVTRTVKDGQLRMVFWNEIKPTEEAGGMPVEKEGLQVTNAEAPAPKAPAGKKKGKRGGAPRQRQVRITNTHMKGEIDLSRDYVAPAKQK